MKKLSIGLLLIGITFMTIEANNLSIDRKKMIDLKRWEKQQKNLIPIPIEAILNENSIEVQFMQNVEGQIIFQVKDQQGNIIFEDMVVTSNEQETYKIDLKGFKAGHYELYYIEEDMTLVGEFDIECSTL